MRKKVLSLVLALCMVLTLLPTTAFAQNVSGTTYITTAAELTTAFGSENVEVTGSEGGPFTVKITGDVTYNGNEHLRIATKVTLDLAANATLDLGNSNKMIIVDKQGNNSGDLTITGSGTIKGSHTSAVVQVQNGAALTIQGCTFTTKEQASINGTITALGEGTTLNITGGTFTTTLKNATVINIQKGAHAEILGGTIIGAETRDAGTVPVATVQVGYPDDTVATVVTIGGDTVINGGVNPAISLSGNDTTHKNQLKISGNAKIEAPKSYAIATNGSNSAGVKLDIEGGTITGSSEICGIYLPAGEMTVSGTAEISGGAGIVTRYGSTLTVNGGTITATAEEGTEISVGDGAEKNKQVTPAAVVVNDKDNTEGREFNVDLNGGEFVAPEGVPTVSYQAAAGAEATEDAITVSGGTFVTVDDEGKETPDATVLQYADATKTGINDEGKIDTLSEANAAAMIDKTPYGTLEAAIEAANEAAKNAETKITVLKDCTIDYKPIEGGEKGITIDLGGKTVTVGKYASLHSGSKLRNVLSIAGKVTLSNGYIKTNEKTVEEDYHAISVKDKAELKLDGVTVYGRIDAGEGNKNNCTATITLKGSTVTNDTGTGMGLYAGTTLTVDKDSTVQGTDIGIYIYSPAQSEVEISGTVEATATSNAGAINTKGAGEGAQQTKAKITINAGATIDGGTGGPGIQTATSGGGSIELNVEGGTIKGTTGITAYDGTINVKDGTITGTTGDSVAKAGNGTPAITVEGGKFESKGEPDYSVIKYVDTKTKGVSADGSVQTADKVEDELFIIDFGYMEDKSAVTDGDGKFTSPAGIVYTAADWKDATFYWCFNRALKVDEKVTVKFAISEGNYYTDECQGSAGASPRYASSFLNPTQNAAGAVIVPGDWTISSDDFTVSTDYTVKVTVPASQQTEGDITIGKANLADDCGSKDYAVTSGKKSDGSYYVVGTATNLKSHKNGNGDYGYWFGVEIQAPTAAAQATGYSVKIDNGNEQTSPIDTLVNLANEKGAIIYFNTHDGDKTKDIHNVTITWTGTEEVTTLVIDLTGVEHYHEPTPPAPPAPTYTVTIPATENGTVTVSPKSAAEGATITVTATPNEGCSVDTVVVTDKDGKDVTVTKNTDGTYTFKMPAGGATVTVTFVEGEKPAPSEKFADVDQTAWYAEAIDYVVENGLMNGVSETDFAPNAPTTRAMLVTILYRLEGKPAATKDIPFSDVASGEWYSDAINWAAANGIVDGYGDGTFRPERDLTREEAAAILYRYADYKKYDVTTTDDLTGYTDAGTVSEWAGTYMGWAVGTELIQGTTETTLAPTGGAIRAQIATILMRFCENVAK